MTTNFVVALVLGGLLGAVLGGAVVAVVQVRRTARATVAAEVGEARVAEAQAERDRLAGLLEAARRESADVRADLVRRAAELEHERARVDQHLAAWEEDRQRLTGVFAELSTKALRQNTEQFWSLAESRIEQAQLAARSDLARREQAFAEALRPLGEALGRYQEGLRRLEIDRKEAYAGLKEQVSQIRQAHDQLHRETRNLATALRAPQTRGRWGEMQLRRVVEVAGMVQHCDFDEQVTTTADDGRLRPDLVVHLPGGAQVVVDAKVPLEAFLHAVEADEDGARKAAFQAHARQLRTHVDQLAKKQYWSQFSPSPEFVVAFVPGDPLLAAAFEHDAGLIEHAMANRVLLATPTTLIALLRTVSFSWQQEALAENARRVQQLGSELYERLRVLGGHFGRLHRHLTGTVEAFNDAMGSLESRVLVTARRFAELGVVGTGQELAEAPVVLSSPRPPRAGAEGELPGGGVPAPARPT